MPNTHAKTVANGPLTRLVAAGAVAVALVAVSTISGVAPRAAAAGAQVSYQVAGVQAGSLSSGFSTGSGADGWALAPSSTQLFNVSHHAATLIVACHNQSDASSCWNGTKTVTEGGKDYATSVGAGLYLNQANGRLYVYAVEVSTQTAGVACIDTSLPASATGSQMGCGFTGLTGSNDAPIVIGGPTLVQSGLSAPVQVGNNWYAFNSVANATGGAKNTLLCFDLVAVAPCASQPFAVPFGGLTVSTTGAGLPIGASGTDVFVQVSGTTVNSTTVNNLACFDSVTKQGCTGTWPVAVPAVTGAPFPLFNSSAVATGICLPITNNPCFSFTGSSVATPPGMGTSIGLNSAENGVAVVLNNSVYVPNGLTGRVGCYNFSTQANCVNFPKQFNIYILYTVNPDPYRATCVWVNSNGRPDAANQIQNFDALTGQPCTQGFVRIPASTLVNPAPVCRPTSYQTLQLVNPTRNSYTSATVGFQDASGNSLGIPDQALDAFGSVDLSGLGLQAFTDPLFVIRFTGLTQSPATFNYRLSWTGAYNTTCTSSGQSVSSVPGYWMVASDGGIFNYGNAGFYGSAGAIPLNKPIVGIAALQNRGGYWLVASDGGIFNYGYANFYGSTGAISLNKPIVGMAATPSGKGYWLVASDGGIFAYGDAAFYGSTGAISLNKPIVGMAATSDGGGYWLVASDGGIFAYGDAAFYGSTGAISLNKPIVGMAANPNGGGYWLVASDGGIFSYGNVGFYGSSGAIKLNKPIVGMAATFSAKGYWLVASDGGIFSYGDAVFVGSAGALPLNKPIVSMAS